MAPTIQTASRDTANDQGIGDDEEGSDDHRWAFRLATLIAVAYFALLVRLCGGLHFNAYPYMSDDGFDWLHQGHALWAMLSGIPTEPLPVLRPPGFVAITALDAAFGGSGYVILVAYSAALYLTLWTLASLGSWLKAPIAVTLSVIAITATAPINFWRLLILADSVAVALMLASAYLLTRGIAQPSPVRILGAGLFALAAGLTQTYGMIPLLIMGTAACVGSIIRERRFPVLLAGVIVATPILWLAATFLWRQAIPHESTPDQFTLLRPSLEMWSFYANTWLFTFAGLLPLAAAVMWIGRKTLLILPPFVTGMWLSAMTFAVLTFCYQWQESRFTFLWFPIVAMALLTTIAMHDNGAAASRRSLPALQRWAVVGVVLTLVHSLCLVPDTYWRPTISSIRMAPESTWIATAFQTRKVDRFRLKQHCGRPDRFCGDVPPYDGASVYVREVLQAHIVLLDRMQRHFVEPNDMRPPAYIAAEPQSERDGKVRRR